MSFLFAGGPFKTFNKDISRWNTSKVTNMYGMFYEATSFNQPIDTSGSQWDVGGVTNVNTGVFQITTPNSTRVSSYGSYDTTTIDKDITAVMGVTFRVE